MAGTRVPARSATPEWISLALLAGVALALLLAQLPTPRVSLAMTVMALAGMVVMRRHRWAVLVAVVCAGAGWAAFQGVRVLQAQLPVALEGVDVVLEGRIAEMPKMGAGSTRFLFAVDRAWLGTTFIAAPPRVLLTWYRPRSELAAGEQWRLTARLKRPHGLLNPGAFDYERYLLAQRIAATGYVRGTPTRLAPSPTGIARLRTHISTGLRGTAGDGVPGAVVRALAVGDATAIPPSAWELLRATGTTHLISISGLHVSLLGGLVFWAVRGLWARCPGAPRRVPAPVVAALAGALAAGAYAALSGFSVPAQRAAVMFGLAMLALALRREVPVLRVLSVSLIGVLVLDPLAPLAPGLWLSFGAVGAIVYLMAARPGSRPLWTRLLRLQLGLGLLLLVPTLGFFGVFAPAGLLANLLAVPWVSFVTTPLALLAGALVEVPIAGPLSGTLAAQSVRAIFWVLDACARWLPVQTLSVPPWGLLGLAGLGLVMLAAPRGWPGRGAGLACIVPALLYQVPAPSPGEAWVTVLDVGQGLAVVVRSRDHAVVFDTGPPLGPSLDAGVAAVLPALRSAGIRRVDALVLSHADSDHAGGYASVMAALPVGEVWSGTPEQIPPLRSVRACRRGEAWTWDGVHFEFLHPTAGGLGQGNASSCVLRVTAGAHGALLTGDIGIPQELALVQAGLEPATVLVASHHGSRNSSAARFAAAVQAREVIFSAGYRSRFGHPHPTVVERFGVRGARCWSTARDGAIALRLRTDGVHVATQRDASRRFWRERAGEAGKCA